MCRKIGFLLKKGLDSMCIKRSPPHGTSRLHTLACGTELPSPDWTEPLQYPAGGSSLPNLLYPSCLKGTGTKEIKDKETWKRYV